MPDLDALDLLGPGDRVTVAEYDEGTRLRKPGGLAYPATVAEASGHYIHVNYDDRAVNRGARDVFYRESGWRAWDGEMRWRLEAQS